VIRVMVVDDHELVRLGICAVLDESGEFLVVGECMDGAEVVPAARALRPDVVLMDLSMKVIGGIDATIALREVIPDARIVVFTSSVETGAMHSARKAGAAGYLLKTAPPATLMAALRVVACGGQAW
jgi:DNA-binding NarL/FixJ family response regulator